MLSAAQYLWLLREREREERDSHYLDFRIEDLPAVLV